MAITIQNEKGQEVSFWIHDECDIFDANSKEISAINLTFNNNILYTCDGELMQRSFETPSQAKPATLSLLPSQASLGQNGMEITNL